MNNVLNLVGRVLIFYLYYVILLSVTIRKLVANKQVCYEVAPVRNIFWLGEIRTQETVGIVNKNQFIWVVFTRLKENE